MQLYEWLQKHGHQVKLEPYLKELSQRPDLLVTLDKEQFAVEFQCSTISHEKWHQRTMGYERNDIQAIWLFKLRKAKKLSTASEKLESLHSCKSVYNDNGFTIFIDVQPGDSPVCLLDESSSCSWAYFHR